jgi:hypothetical protein
MSLLIHNTDLNIEVGLINILIMIHKYKVLQSEESIDLENAIHLNRASLTKKIMTNMSNQKDIKI